MSHEKQVNAQPRQVTFFLDRIRSDLDRELLNIDTQKQDTITQLRREAFAESRRIHRQATKQARARQSQRQDRYLAAVDAKLRRRHWRLLTDSQQRVVDAVWARMMDAWSDPEHQWNWCRAWLDEARKHSGSDSVQISLGKGAHADVCKKIELTMADYPGHFELLVDESASEGIVIRWADYMLDGTLHMQYPELLKNALRRITDIVYPGSES